MKFNTKSNHVSQVVNYEGARAFVLNPAMQLYTAVVTWSLNDSFYEKDDTRLIRIQTLIAQNDPLFVARLAIYARNQMYMRSVPLVLITELAKIHTGDDLVSRMIEKVVLRADEITELLACYQLLNNRSERKKLNRLSKQVQKGLANAFNRFDEYQFAKYNRATEIKLRDALFLIHPKAKNESQQVLFDKIANNSLETPYTWETELSALGQQKFANEVEKQTAFKRKWEELIDSDKLGYMALLRNLRNIVEAQVSYNHIQKIGATLASAEKVAKAKQFPFRYLAAYRELLGAGVRVNASGITGKFKRLIGENGGFTGEILEALEQAVTASAANVPGFNSDTSVLLACDVSGSMQIPVSAKSKIQLYDVGLMLAMLLQSRCKNVRIGMFGDTWKTITVPKNNILANVQEFYRREGEVGYSTNGFLVIRNLLDKKLVMDKVMLFTDCQLWNSTGGNEHIHPLWVRYKREVAPKAKLYLFDLKGYGQSPLQVIQDDVYLLAGWSDKIFGVLEALENGKSALEEINQISI